MIARPRFLWVARALLPVLLPALLVALLPGCSGGKTETDGGVDGGPDTTAPVDLVDPFIGSGGRYFGFGSTFPGACLPHGLAKPGPDTATEHGAAEFHHFSGYHYEDDHIHGFSQVHISGTGAVDYGALLLMPTSGFGPDQTSESGYRSRFAKADEQAAPGYYAVRLADSDIQVEITATRRSALYRIGWPAGESEPVLVLDASHALPNCHVEDARVVATADGQGATGWVHYHGSLTGRSGGFRLYFQLRFSRAASGRTGFGAGGLEPGAEDVAGPEAGMAFSFAPAAEPLLVRVGLSYVDGDGAAANLEAEQGGADFGTIRDRARAVWAAELERIRVEGGSRDERVMFYTALYHTLLHPTLFSDGDGRYPGFDGRIHSAEGWDYYSDFSLWDTYRCTHSLYTLLVPERHRDMLRSLLAMAAQGGSLPKWPAATGYTGCMIGTPADVVLAEAFLKGIAGVDWQAAYAAVVSNATEPQPHAGRAHVERYLELGYLPADEVGGSAARTLEFGVADGAIAAWATALGLDEDAADFGERARGYRQLWDAETQFLRGKNADGSWAAGEDGFEPLDWAAPWYTEGTAWQYSWLAPHDPQGLLDLFPSRQAALDKLEALFATPEPDDPLREFLPDVYYWHGNEPDIHAVYLFNDLGRADRTQYWVRRLLADEYGTGADGLPGNDDLGTMSAWYVFSAAGFYPSAGQTWYWLGSPLFERVVFALGDGGQLELRAPGASAERRYIQSARLDGRQLTAPRLEHADIAGGALLELELADSPGDWGVE